MQFRFEVICIFESWNADRLMFVHVFLEQLTVHLFFEFLFLLLFGLWVYFVFLLWFLVEFVNDFFFVHLPLIKVGCCSGLHIFLRGFLFIGFVFAVFVLGVVPEEGHRTSSLFSVIE